MKPHLALLCCGVLGLSGCAWWNGAAVRSQSPGEADESTPAVKLVGDLAVHFGMFPVRVENVGLVTGLPGTGSDPAPSPQRAALVAEMQTRGVSAPNTVLASKNISLVLVRAYLRPGIQKGDRVDVEVRVPSRSETTSLRGGWLLQTRLKELAVLDNQIHDGHVLALAEGPILVDPSANGQTGRVALGRGRILGGGVALKSRPLGLVLKPGHRSAANSARMAAAINKRFYTVQRGVQMGVAKAKTDEFIELTVHPRYKDNIERYLQVVGAVALRESAAEQVERIAKLRQKLLQPVSAADAARQLEAIGRDGVETLRAGIQADAREVRFYAAEALAYLDQREAAAPLGEMARQEPAFRVFALAALGAMDDRAAYEQLRDLLGVPSAETRYGAFRALWAMNPTDPLVAGEQMGQGFTYHVLGTAGPPMIHLTRSRRPELVVFGQDQRFQGRFAVDAGPQIMVTSAGQDEVSVSKYTVSEPDQKRVVSSRVDDVVRAIVELGGTYPDVVQGLEQAKAAGSLPSRLEVDALPEAGRSYHRLAKTETEAGDDQAGSDRSQPVKDRPAEEPLSQSDPSGTNRPGSSEGKSQDSASDSSQKPRPAKGLFAKMLGRRGD